MIHILTKLFTILPLSLSSYSLAAVAVVMTVNSARIAATLDCAAVPALGTVATFASKANALAKASAQEFVTKMVSTFVRTSIQKNVAAVHAKGNYRRFIHGGFKEFVLSTDPIFFFENYLNYTHRSCFEQI